VDNKLALNAGWDLEMLSLEIGELGEAGFDLSITGFDEFELGELFPERTPRSDRLRHRRRAAGTLGLAAKSLPRRSPVQCAMAEISSLRRRMIDDMMIRNHWRKGHNDPRCWCR
jgi:hypothetical protein